MACRCPVCFVGDCLRCCCHMGASKGFVVEKGNNMIVIICAESGSCLFFVSLRHLNIKLTGTCSITTTVLNNIYLWYSRTKTLIFTRNGVYLSLTRCLVKHPVQAVQCKVLYTRISLMNPDIYLALKALLICY